MKRPLFFLLIFLPVYLIFGLYFLDKHPFLCPVDYQGDVIIRHDGRGNGFFGAERNGNRLHLGLDLLAKVGAPVIASRSGKVILARRTRGMGNFVIIRHSGRTNTLYGHLSRIYVHAGQFVRQGQIIGSVGKTGNANFRNILPHLHFEVRKNGFPQDPLKYLE